MQGILATWRFRAPEADLAALGALPLRERILAVRGFVEPESLSAYLEPRLTHLHDPSLIPDLDRAAERILNACTSGGRIAIYGDYDVDGVTGTAILWHILRAIAPQSRVTTYVPHRVDEGYGLNCEAIRALARDGANVIVSVDCGITALEQARTARSLGVDLIITDHHNPPASLDDLPDAYAVVHPRRPDSAYPFGDLSGAGVAYKLAWRLATLHAGAHRVSPEVRELLVNLLAFAALGAIADIVPLRGENRVIARHGLVRCKHSPFVGLRALVEASDLAGESIDAMDVGFRLGPRLNAAGRMGHARKANELFTTDDPRRAAEIAAALSQLNRDRQSVERAIFDQADEMARAMGMTGAGSHAIVLAHPGWHPGVIGIVCSRLVERHCRPVILMNRENGVCHGSGRSIEGFNLHGALADCGEHIERFGGHDMAAGLHIVEPKLKEFVRAFSEVALERIAPTDICRRITIDCEAGAGDLTAEAVDLLGAIEPCGAGNPDASLLVRNAVIADRPVPLGAHAKHLAIPLKIGDRRIRSVAWNFGVHREKLAAGQRVDVVIRPKISTWTGRPTFEPEVRDLAVHGS